MQSPRLEAGPADPGMQHLPEVVRARLDSWYPSHLPARFRVPAPRRTPLLLRPLPLALAALLLVLLAASAAAGSTRTLTDAIVNLANARPAASPTPRPHSDSSSAPAPVRPAAATIVATPIPAVSGPIAVPAPEVRTAGTASGARVNAPTPGSTPAPSATPSPTASVSPEVVDGNPGANRDTLQPAPPPQPTSALPLTPQVSPA
jgi:hypothetical protein